MGTNSYLWVAAMVPQRKGLPQTPPQMRRHSLTAVMSRLGTVRAGAGAGVGVGARGAAGAAGGAEGGAGGGLLQMLLVGSQALGTLPLQLVVVLPPLLLLVH